MPASAGAAAATSASSSPRKRPRTSAAGSTSTSARAPTTSAPPPSSSFKTAPPMSAVAARRAARLAAAPAAPPPPPPSAPHAGVSPDDEEADSHSDAGSNASSSSAEQAPQPKRKQQQQKSKGPTRYFAASEPEVPRTREEDGEGMEVDAGAVSPPEGLDAVSDIEPDAAGPATPVRARRRREKSAFIDPLCTSAFHFLDGVNAVRTTVVDEGGVQRDAVVYALQVGETLVFRGACTLTPVYGHVKVLGATLAPTMPTEEDTVTVPPLSPSASHPLFAPSSHPLPPIFGAPLSTPASCSLLLPSGETLDLTPYCAVVLVSDLVTGIEGIERVLVAGGMGQGSGMFARKKGKAPAAQGGATWSLVLEPEPSLAGLRPPDPWLAALAAAVPPGPASDDDDHDALPVAERFVALVEGPKRAGKSTFAKVLLNSLLTRYGAVAYLDTDLGQPEFTPSGFLSLNLLRQPILGPSFTHISLPLASRFLGSTSPASDPTAYLEAAQALIEAYALEVEYPLDSASPGGGKVVERVPLVINTQGWVKGLGADLLDKLKAIARPTHVFSFSQPDDAPAPVLGAPTILLPPAPPSPLEGKWSAADYRVLSLVSYFHAHLASTSTTPAPPSWDFTRPLLAQEPFALTLADLPGGVRLASAAGESIPHSHLLHALNSALVALVAAPPASSLDETGVAPRPASCSALGLALVHSIAPGDHGVVDRVSTTLHVHTPVPACTLSEARPSLALVKGELDLPVALMLDWAAPGGGESGVAGVDWREVPFLSVDAAEASGRRRVRRNVMRRGQA